MERERKDVALKGVEEVNVGFEGRGQVYLISKAVREGGDGRHEGVWSKSCKDKEVGRKNRVSSPSRVHT